MTQRNYPLLRKRGFSSQKERTDMIKNILHKRTFVGDYKKIPKNCESTSSKKAFHKKMVAEASILIFQSSEYPTKFYGREKEIQSSME